MPSLVIERGQEKGFSFPLRTGATVVIGRDPANEVIISDPAASRRHFQVRDENGTWVVSDLGSRNHTYVNEERLETEQVLAYGDRIQVGETVFSFLEEDQAEKGKAGGLAGRDIAGYKILERIGRGGMGTVYKARQISLNRIVALKLLSSRYANDPSFVEKFVAEARAAAQLNHPNVVQVFDVGTVGGLHFFSMEFMEGGAVQDLLTQSEDSRLHWTEALPMIMDAARGLVFAERHNIVHRDIKPDNLMLTVENKVKIGDLGLAARSDEVGDGKIFGTPHFIAPEQARGKDVGHAADIYSLGASFYRMVSGRTPFSGETVKDILRAQVNEAHRPLIEEVPDFPPDLSAIVDKMMAKAVEDRYQSATDLVKDLEAFQIEHQIELAGGRKVNKGLIAVGAVVILALAGVVAWQLSKDPETIVEERIIERNTGNVNTGPTLTPEQIRAQKERERELAAKAAFFETKSTEPGQQVALDDKEGWLEQAKAYDALAAKSEFKSTPSAADATARAKEIRETLQRLEQERAATVGAAKTWWERQEAVIDEKLTAGDWTAVLRAAAEIPESADAKKHLQYVPEATKYLQGLEAEVLRRARTELDTTLAEAQKKLDGGQPSEALSSVDGWEQAMREHAPAHEKLAELADSARSWVTDREETLTAELEEALIQDRMTYVDICRSVRALPPPSPSVFQYVFGALAGELEARRAELKTWIYRNRLDRRVAQLRAADAGWGAFVAALDAGEIVGKSDVLVGFDNMPRGARVTLSSSRPVTREGFMVDISISGGTGGRPFDWEDLTPNRIWEIFLRDRHDEIPGEVALGLARVFVEVGHAEAAQHLLERATVAGVEIAPRDKAELESEIAALTEYDSLRAADDLEPEQVMARVTAWRSRHVYTEAFLLLDGRETQRLPEIMPQGERERFVKSWGVPPK